MTLSAEIDTVKTAVVTDAYQMSFGEIANLYNDGDLSIDPAFQRLFRWTISQKSRFIESMLLGIPIPSIFVFETEGGKWELVDGLQRVSTVLEFLGNLKIDGKPMPPSCLEGTSYLPSLHNAVWEKSKRVAEVPLAEQNPISKIEQLALKRSRVGVEILKRPSDPKTKYDLFQRLNSGGTLANAQELRNCVVVMVDAEAFKGIEELAGRASFESLTQSTEDQKRAQRHMEYAMRFLVYRHVPYDGRLDVEEYFDQGIVSLLTGSGLTTAIKKN